MDLNRNDWYVRLFFWSLGIWGAFRDDSYDSYYRYDLDYMEKHGTNLCFFIRVMVLYMPLILLLHAILAVIAVASLTALPIYLFGGSTYGWTVVALAMVVLIILGVSAMFKSLALRECTRERKTERKQEERPEVAEEPRGPSFWTVLWAYLVAAKKKICPSVMFLNSQQEVR